MSDWINDETRIWKKNQIDKPCHTLGYCPYGQLVEEYPLHPEFPDDADLNALAKEGTLNTGYNCTVFGHDCPVFYQAERIDEKSWEQAGIDYLKKQSRKKKV